MASEALFIDVQPGPVGRRFALHHQPRSGRALGLAVYVHPFAEEMNKSRRMAALQAAALAQAGWAVLQVDLLGCGDSAGDFGQASWDAWVDDVVEACHWLTRRYAPLEVPLCLWGLRSGCLLASAAARRMNGRINFLFWQPVVNGQSLLQQFLRLKLAGELASGTGKQAMESARRALSEGESVEVAGYSLAPPLAQGLATARLEPPTQRCHVDWFELTTRDDATLSPAGDIAATHWQASGHTVRRRMAAGPPFWQTTEIEVASDLLNQTTEALALTQAMVASGGLPG